MKNSRTQWKLRRQKFGRDNKAEKINLSTSENYNVFRIKYENIAFRQLKKSQGTQAKKKEWEMKEII